MPAEYLDRQMRVPEAVRVLIPEGWEQLSVVHRCRIASDLSGMKVVGGKHADTIIRHELKRRG